MNNIGYLKLLVMNKMLWIYYYRYSAFPSVSFSGQFSNMHCRYDGIETCAADGMCSVKCPVNSTYPLYPLSGPIPPVGQISLLSDTPPFY